MEWKPETDVDVNSLALFMRQGFLYRPLMNGGGMIDVGPERMHYGAYALTREQLVTVFHAAFDDWDGTLDAVYA